MIEAYDVGQINSIFQEPVREEQCCLLHMYRQEHILQIAQEVHYCKGNHGLHRVSDTLQWHPTCIAHQWKHQ